MTVSFPQFEKIAAATGIGSVAAQELKDAYDNTGVFISVDAAPDGVVTAALGTLAVLSTNGTVYQNIDGNTAWIVFQSAAPGGGTSTTSLGNLAVNTIFSNWSPAGLLTNRILTLRASDDTGSIITGIDSTGIALGDIRTLCNWGGLEDAAVLCLTNLDTRSLAANRIMTPGADVYHGAAMPADFYVGPGESVDLMYSAPLHDDPTFRAWVVMGGKRRHSAITTQQLQVYPPIYAVPITGTNNNYSPVDDSPYVSNPGAVPSSEGGNNGTFQSNSLIILQTVDVTGATITGLSYPTGKTEGLGPIKYLYNAGPGPITLVNGSASSDPINRFDFGSTVTEIVLQPERYALAVWHQRDTGGWIQLIHGDSVFDSTTLEVERGARFIGTDPGQPLGVAWQTNLLANNDLTGRAEVAAVGNVAQLTGRDEGTYDTTAAALKTYAVLGIANSSRSAGANPLTNNGGYFTASNGQVNWALFTDAGNCVFNAGGGESSFIGTLNALGQFVSAGAQVLTGILTPPALGAADNPDYAPTGFSTSRILRLTGDVGGLSTLSGLAGGTNGRIITLVNVSANVVNVLGASVLSVAANRFASAVTLAATGSPGASQSYFYDGTSALWRAI